MAFWFSRASRSFRASLIPSSLTQHLLPPSSPLPKPSAPKTLTPTPSHHQNFSPFEFPARNFNRFGPNPTDPTVSTSSSAFDATEDGRNRSTGSGGNGGARKPSRSASSSWIDLYLPSSVQPYARLARLDKPIGTWLLAWPCMWYASHLLAHFRFLGLGHFIKHLWSL